MWLWIILGTLLVVAIVSGILAIVLTKKGSQKAVEDAAAAHQAELAAASDETATIEIATTEIADTTADSTDTPKDEEE